MEVSGPKEVHKKNSKERVKSVMDLIVILTGILFD